MWVCCVRVVCVLFMWMCCVCKRIEMCNKGRAGYLSLHENHFKCEEKQNDEGMAVDWNLDSNRMISHLATREQHGIGTATKRTLISTSTSFRDLSYIHSSDKFVYANQFQEYRILPAITTNKNFKTKQRNKTIKKKLIIVKALWQRWSSHEREHTIKDNGNGNSNNAFPEAEQV